MRALITGGAGFIGSHLTEHLTDQGWSVVILDDLSTGVPENLPQTQSDAVQVIIGSVTDRTAVAEAMMGVDVVFHLAAAVGVLNIQHHTLTSLKTNLHGTEYVLEAAYEAGAKFLLTSTSEVYGKNTTVGLTEDADRVMGSPLLSRWSYAEAKALDETLVQQYHLTHDMDTVIVRLFNTTGPRQTGRYGMVLPRLVRQALHNEPLTVYGTGEQTRCFGQVHDVVPAIATLAHTSAAIGQVFNIGSSEQISINDLAARIIERTGSSSQVRHIDYETAYGAGYEDMERRVPDCTKLRDLIGFQPRFNLNDTIDSVIASEAAKLAVAA